MSQNNYEIGNSFVELVEIMRKLRRPEGCSWDRKQTMQSLAENILEEAKEVFDAINSGDYLHVCEELGDLLMVIVFHAQIASEEGKFDMDDVSKGICQKLIRRHPHVFGDSSIDIDSEQVMQVWGEIKKQEKIDRSRISNRMREALKCSSSLTGAEKVQEEAAKVGFDWDSAKSAFPKIAEETEEVGKAMNSGKIAELEEEVGDLIFSVLNVSRLSGISAEKCLKNATAKFVERFSAIEPMVEADGGFGGKTLEELDKYWDIVKKQL